MENDKTGSLNPGLLDHERPPYNTERMTLPDFGLYHLNVVEAAELIAIDMWFSGAIDALGIPEPEGFDGEPTNPMLKGALKEVILEFVVRLTSAIDSGKLEAAQVLRGLDEVLVPQSTFVARSALVEWLQERGVELGDAYEEWDDMQDELVRAAFDAVMQLQSLARAGKQSVRNIAYRRRQLRTGSTDKSDHESVLASYTELLAENASLKQKLALAQSSPSPKVDRPITTRARRTLLTVIAALCKHGNLDLAARGAAQRIKGATELLGVPVDDGTIQAIINEIPDALDARRI